MAEDTPPLPALPAGFTWTVQDESLCLKRRWLGGSRVLLGAILFLFGSATFSLAMRPGEPWFAALLAAPLLFVGALSALASLLNVTTIRVSANELQVTTRPFPLVRDIRVPVADVFQVYLRQNPKRDTVFTLVLALRDGRELRLLSGFDISVSVARRLEATLEDRMGVRDRRMTHER